MLEKIKWLGHASFKITGEKLIYIDPWKLKDKEPADIILITHSHYDHFSPGDIEMVKKDGTVFITISEVARKLKGALKTVKAGDKLTVEGIDIEVVPAYNIDKPYHPKGEGIGFIITVGGERIYHAGDTDLIPEMDTITTDVALLPVGGTYTMDAEEAAKAANKIKPRVAIPMHYGTIVGSEKDAERFKELCDLEVAIL